MATKDTVVQELVVNTLTQAQFDAAKEAGKLSPYELYGTPDTSADRDLMNTTDNVDIVIESQLPTADNGYTWYRKYKSGWVEQGGVSSSQTVTLPIEMADTSYSIQLTGTCDSTKNNVVIHGFRNRTTTSFVTQGNVVNNNGESAASNTSTKFWQVSGMAA